MSRAEEELLIVPGAGDRSYWRDLWAYRELLYFLAWRDILVRYKQTVLGVAWALLRPLVTMLVFTLVFGRLAGLPSTVAPYPLLIFAALLPWQFCANALGECSTSLITNVNLVSKVYFPRLLVPLSTILVSLVDLLLCSGLLLLLMGWYRCAPDWRILCLPAFLGLALLSVLGAGFWLAALTVRYRDFRYVIPVLLQLGLFLSPVGFSSAVVPERWRLLYSLNPLVGVIDGFRWALLGEPLYLPGVALSLLLGTLLLVCGLGYFRRTERAFADVI